MAGWIVGWVLAGVALAGWLYLVVGHGGFWRTSIRLPPVTPVDARPAADGWPSVAAIVPARDEAEMLPRTLPTLLSQRYPGAFRVLVVDDDSGDGTGDIAAALGAAVVRTDGPPPGWVGKVAAMAAGVAAVTGTPSAPSPAGTPWAPSPAMPPDPPRWLLFTDADIAFPPSALTTLVRAAEGSGSDMVSQMARLRTDAFWERWIVPAFVYFFAQLYPFSRVNRPGRTAAAAGGCMLVRRQALADAGGLASIRAALIDDVALARLIGRRGRIWLGLSTGIRSVRAYPRLADLWAMVARSAYTQLRHSPVLLLGTVLGLLLGFVVPPAAAITGAVLGDPVLAALGGTAWLMMAGSYLPMLRCYRLGAWRAPLLPLVAVLYLGMTVDSARRHHAGRGGAWKGRTASRSAG
ncbi:MAG TPA: glycosyltransferase [Nakamurella sp.]|nr:glycosyltransferase [Nakamurella sp.]